jgi:hypothetical protein
LFPVNDGVLDSADPVALSQFERKRALVYVGNEYDRDESFAKYFVPAARTATHLVAGKWLRKDRWPGVEFCDRVPFADVENLYRGALATVLLLPVRYATAGQMTQRLFEAVLAGCIPITPAYIRSRALFTPSELHARDGSDVSQICRRLHDIAGTADHIRLIARCLRYLDLFRVSRQLTVLEQVLRGRAVTMS